MLVFIAFCGKLAGVILILLQCNRVIANPGSHNYSVQCFIAAHVRNLERGEGRVCAPIAVKTLVSHLNMCDFVFYKQHQSNTKHCIQKSVLFFCLASQHFWRGPPLCARCRAIQAQAKHEKLPAKAASGQILNSKLVSCLSDSDKHDTQLRI